MKNKIQFPLMRNNILESDFNVLIKFLKKKPILTQNKNVKNFEEKWSKWLGVKYSVFVNSGSSANLLQIQLLKMQYPKVERLLYQPLLGLLTYPLYCTVVLPQFLQI